MPRLVEHLNVYSTCLAILQNRGWEISIIPGPYEKSDQLLDSYSATRDGTTLEANTPLSLLGLSAIHEHHHPHTDESDWWWVDGKELNEQLVNAALNQGFWNYFERDPEGCKKEVVAAIKESAKSKYTPYEILGISREVFQLFVKRHLESSR